MNRSYPDEIYYIQKARTSIGTKNEIKYNRMQLVIAETTASTFMFTTLQ